MSVAQRVFPKAEALGELRELAELVRHPEAIIQAHETARRQMQMTEAEERRLSELRALAGEWEQKQKEIEERRAAVEAAAAAQERKAEASALAAADTDAALERRKRELDLVAEENDQTRKKIEADRKRALEDIAARMAQCEVRESEWQRREAAGKAQEEANGMENARLARLRESLNARARAIATAAQLEE